MNDLSDLAKKILNDKDFKRSNVPPGSSIPRSQRNADFFGVTIEELDDAFDELISEGYAKPTPDGIQRV